MLKEFLHFFSLILWVAAGLAFVAEWSAPGQGMAKIGYAIVAVILAILIGLLFFAIGRMIGVSFWQDFIFAIGIIVAMVPEGLLPTLTLSLMLATQRMAKRSVFIRYLPSVEALGSTTVICTDKTGTLTQNRMTVKRLFVGETLDSLALGEQSETFTALHRRFFLTARLCHDLKGTEDHGSTRFLG